MKKPTKLSTLTRSQYCMLYVTKMAQQTVKYASFGQFRPRWVLPLAGHFCIINSEKEKLKTGDSKPDLPSNRWYKEIDAMLASRYKCIALVSTS